MIDGARMSPRAKDSNAVVRNNSGDAGLPEWEQFATGLRPAPALIPAPASPEATFLSHVTFFTVVS
jgi:hypothetical protein